jgi:hypothetical protein
MVLERWKFKAGGEANILNKHWAEAVARQVLRVGQVGSPRVTLIFGRKTGPNSGGFGKIAGKRSGVIKG